MLGHQRQGDQGSESVYLHFGLGYWTIRNRQCALQNPGAGNVELCNSCLGIGVVDMWGPHTLQ